MTNTATFSDSDNEIVLAAFAGWLTQRPRAAFKDNIQARTYACIAGIRRFSYFIEPVSLRESTLAELRAFKTEIRGHERQFPIRKGMQESPALGRFIRRLRHSLKKELSAEDKSALLGITMFERFRREVLKKVQH
jgi:hypothetical protein